MEQSSPIYPKCKFCQKESLQTRLLLRSIYRRLKRQLEAIQSQEGHQMKKAEGNGFKQLIRILFPSFLQKNDQCQHDYYSICLSEKLGVAFEKFLYLCAQISSSIAEHNYQLEIIIAQIKNVAESIAEKRVEGEDSSDQSQVSIELKRRRGKLRRQIKRQVKQSQQQRHEKYENSNEYLKAVHKQPQMKSEISCSSQSNQPFSHYGYFIPYSFIFDPNHSKQ